MKTPTLKQNRRSVNKFLFPACSLGLGQNGPAVRLDAGEGPGFSPPSALVKVAATLSVTSNDNSYSSPTLIRDVCVVSEAATATRLGRICLLR